MAIENNLFRLSRLSNLLVDSGACVVRICRRAEEQVVDLGMDLTTMVGIILAPVLLVGLIAVPFYRWITRKLVGFIEDHDRPQA